MQPTMYRPEVSRSAQSRSHTMAYTYRTRAQIPQLRARQSTNSALKQESNRCGLRIPEPERFSAEKKLYKTQASGEGFIMPRLFPADKRECEGFIVVAIYFRTWAYGL